MNLLLLIVVLSGAPDKNFVGLSDSSHLNNGKVNTISTAAVPCWILQSNLCAAVEFEACIPTKGLFTLELSANPTNNSWTRFGEPIECETATTNRQTCSVPAPETGEWFYRLREIPPVFSTDR